MNIRIRTVYLYRHAQTRHSILSVAPRPALRRTASAIAIAITQSSCAPSPPPRFPSACRTNVWHSPNSRGLRNNSGSASQHRRQVLNHRRTRHHRRQPSILPTLAINILVPQRLASAPAPHIHDCSAPPPAAHRCTPSPAPPPSAPAHTEESVHATPRTAIPVCRSITCAHA